jgi:hypothetical protein
MLGVSAVEGGLAMDLDLGCGVEVDRRRGVHADPGVAMLMVVGGEEPLAERAGVGERPEPVREVGHILEGLNCASEYGLSFEHRGRECDRRTPRSVMSSDTGFEVIEPPRSAWIVCGARWLRAMASVRKSFATTASSVLATSHPTT